MSEYNLGALHRRVAERLGPRTALRYKEYGRYRDYSYADYRSDADAFAAHLISLGIQAGDHIGLLSENRYEWLVTDIGILSAGAADVPMHAPLSPKQIEYQLSHSEARGVIVSNQLQADKVLEVAGDLPNLEFLISFDPLEPQTKLQYWTWDGFLQAGRNLGADGQYRVLSREGMVGSDSLATIIYTSGTTGNPKGVMLTHGNLQSNSEAMLESGASQAGDLSLSWLPYSHIYARTVDHYQAILAQMTVCIAESVETLVLNLAETQPSWMASVPRFYEKLWAMVGHLDAEVRSQQLQKIFGPRLRQLSSGGAPLPKHIAEGFIAAGISLMDGYGLTESSPVITFNRLDDNKTGTVGKAIPGVEIKIGDEGEILTRGPHVMKGYWKNPDATAETIVEGWLHTGDVGEIDDDGFLTITDRKKDLIITSGGKNISPTELETLLVSDVFIDQAVTYGDGRQFVSALLVPNFPQLEAKAAELGASLTADGDFLCEDALVAFYEERVARVMEAVSQPERVKRILVLARPFQLEENELTATLKVRRRFIIDKYRDQLDALYTAAVTNADQGD
ncbi:Long-chain-fatty-acid--CoA ligase FadD15 [Symmachiella macrocystis]|uniref:Long-chain-fatty-acid--CoA ligase FadD15 n=1 Tax=Symmachiella macrocystis TaxID=2527985 RepID=A0A5C6BUX4_9PLAN|nr:long-chain fatty acid--CoA ligase [Symmachiella macrocystis]TWU14484.1 Long-chain-fatty-acid--CoA ligase FadD15 [Symmachiella macrocystis]